ncbi:BACON domain-containing protein [Thalassotalea piscium]
MKEKLSNLYRFFILIILATTLQACGSDTPDPKAGYSISADVNRINFTYDSTAEQPQSLSITVNYTGKGLLLGYAPDSQAVGWLSFHTENLTDNSATVIVELSNIENYQQNLYQTKIRLSTGDANNAALVHHDIDVSLLVAKLLSFSATLGESSLASQSIELNLDSQDWTFAADVDWLTVEPLTTDGITTLTVTPNLSEFAQPGLYHANITITENSSGDIDNIPVELGIDNLYLIPSKPTIAFTKTLNTQALKQTITINSNSVVDVNWQATSNQPWVIVTKQNETSLSVSVDPSKLTNAELSTALITVTANDNTSIIDAEIPITLYQSTLQTKNKVLEDLTLNTNGLVSAVGNPYFFAAVGNELRTYHQYTGELLSTIAVSPSDSNLEQLIMHPEGKFLLAKAEVTTTNDDETTTTTTHRYKINLVEDTVTELIDSDIEYEPLAFVTFSGRHFVITQALEFADNNLHRLYWDSENAFPITGVDQADETEALYVLETVSSTFKKITARVNDFTTNKIVPEIVQEYRPESLPEDGVISNFVISDDESALFLVSGTSEWISIDGESYIDQGLLTQTEDNTTLTIQKDNQGHIAFTRFDPAVGIIVDVYSQDGSLRNTIATAGAVPQAFSITQDSQQLILQTNTQVELVALATIAISDTNLSFLGTYGDLSIDSQTITLDNIGLQWQASTDATWLELTPDNSGEQARLVVTVDTSTITNSGLYTGVITIIDPESGDSINLVVELAIDDIRLFANYPALSFDQQLDRSLLSQTVKVLTNKNSVVPWKSTTNVDWLTLSENLSDNTLTVTVDPSVVSTNGIHSGKITLSPIALDDSLSGSIVVTFNKGDFDTSTLSEISIDNVTPNTSAIALDPLRPYLYVAQLDKIDVYNIIDGSKVTSISSPLEEVNLTNLVIHPDGSLLLASNLETYLDEQEEEQTRVNHYQVNLSDFSITQLDNDKIDLTFRPNNIVMVDGKPVVVSQALELANMSLEVQYWDVANTFLTSTIHKVPDNNILLAYNGNTASIIENSLRVNTFADKTISSTEKNSYSNVNFLVYGLPNITTSSDGQALYNANSASEWASKTNSGYIDNGTLPSSQTLSTIKVVTDTADNTYVYRKTFINGYGEAHTLTRYDGQQQQIEYSAYTAGSNSVLISPNYHRLIHFNEDKLVIDFIKQ